MIYRNTKRLILLLTCAVIGVLSSCKDQWAAHSELLNKENDLTLFDKIKQQPELSSFVDLLVSTGYDKVLESSKTFTVWAPTNAAMANVATGTFTDEALAKSFVANHIVNQSYSVAALKLAGLTEQRIQTLNGKSITFTTDGVEDAKLIKSDLSVKNGVFHEIDVALEVRKNILDYLNGLTDVGLKQRDFMRSLNYDLDGAGNKVYSAEGLRNDFSEQIARLNNERGEYTYIVLTDAAFDQESAKLSKYFARATTTLRYDSTTLYRTSWNVVKDFVANTIVKPTQLGATLLSSTGVNVPIDKTAIVSSYRASNGMVYVMNKVDFDVFQDKIRPIVIEGESLSSYSQNDKSGSIFTRIRLDGAGLQFSDKFISGTDVASFWGRVRINDLYSTKYKIYWRALNDQAWSTASPSAPVNFKQKLGFSSPTGLPLPYTDITPYITVNYNNPADLTRPKAPFEEVYLGDVTVTSWGTTFLYAIGDAVRTAGLNTISLDYVKLVPTN
ncbi:Fasciclin domain protein [compost metagenome]